MGKHPKFSAIAPNRLNFRGLMRMGRKIQSNPYPYGLAALGSGVITALWIGNKIRNRKHVGTRLMDQRFSRNKAQKAQKKNLN